jgi:hypothetical protein
METTHIPRSRPPAPPTLRGGKAASGRAAREVHGSGGAIGVYGRPEDVGAQVVAGYRRARGRLDALNQIDAGAAPSPTGGHLPQVVRRRAAVGRQASADRHVGDVGLEVHGRHNSTLLPDCNSSLLTGGASGLLDASAMGTALGIKAIKEARRRKLAALLEGTSKFELGKRLDMNPDYLWQMAKGQGGSARGISDKTARKIEEKLGKPTNWMEWDGDHPPVQAASQAVGPDFLKIAGTIMVVRRYTEKLRGSDAWLTDPVLLEIAYGLVEAVEDPVSANNVIELVSRLESRLVGGEYAAQQVQRPSRSARAADAGTATGRRKKAAATGGEG